MINAILVDDEFHALKTLKGLLSMYCPDIRVLGEASTIEKATKLLERLEVDVVFLDINIDGRSGFELLDQFPSPNFQILFVTAFNDFAVKAFRYNAIDYILKPIIPDHLQKAVGKLKNWSADFQSMNRKLSRLVEDIKHQKYEFLTLSTSEGIHVLSVDQIIRLESDRSYTTFFQIDGEKVVISKGIKEYEDLLPNPPFFRMHRSHIINILQIKKVMREEGGYVVMSDNAQLPIARRKKEELLQKLKNISL
ncbi:MAG: LytTR family DNA-binding domain-containing protein [Bacteroidota bacterium]